MPCLKNHHQNSMQCKTILPPVKVGDLRIDRRTHQQSYSLSYYLSFFKAHLMRSKSKIFGCVAKNITDGLILYNQATMPH